MSYLDSDVLGGMLPTPHGDVHITVGPSGDEQMFVSYAGSLEALLALGAIDAHMAQGDAPEGRDAHQRLYRRELDTDGSIKFTRRFSAIKQVADLPGLGGRTPLHVDPLHPRPRHLKLVVSRDD